MASLHRSQRPTLSLPPSYLDPSDLVVDSPVPDGHASHHYHDDRFFTQIEHLRQQVGDAIYVAGTRFPWQKGSYYFSNVFAMYEVQHWPNAAAHAEYTAWVVDTIRNVREEKDLPTLTPAVRKIVKQCLQAWKPGTYCWLHHLFPDLQDVLSDRKVLAQVARNPLQSIVFGPREICHGTEPCQELDNKKHLPPGELDLAIDMDGSLRSTYRIVGNESEGLMIEDSALRTLFVLGLEPRKPRRGSVMRLLDRHRKVHSDDSNSARKGAIHGREAPAAINIHNRPFTTRKAISPVQIDPVDLDAQDNTELDQLFAKMDARDTEKTQSRQGKPGNAALSGARHNSQVSPTSLQADADIISRTSNGTATVQLGREPQSGGASSLTAPQVQVPGIPAAPSHELPGYVAPVLPRTPSQSNAASSPRVPGSDSTIKLFSSSQVAPSPEQRLTAPPLFAPGTLGAVPSLLPESAASYVLPRSPGKIPQNQTPPMTFRDIAAASKRKRAGSQHEHDASASMSGRIHTNPLQKQVQDPAGNPSSNIWDHRVAGFQEPRGTQKPGAFAMAPPPRPVDATSAFSFDPVAHQAPFAPLAQQWATADRIQGGKLIQHPHRQATSQASAPGDVGFPPFQQYVPDVYVPYQYEQRNNDGGNGQ